MKNQLYILLILAVGSICFANSSPTVSSVTANQRTDGSGIVDIYYTLSDADGDLCTVSVVASDDGGDNYNITPTSLSGDLTNVSVGRRHIYWYSKTDLPGEYGTNYRVKVVVDDVRLDEGLVAYYKLDGTSGAVVDEMDNNNGTNYGAERDVTGKVEKCFSFNANDYVVSLSNVNITGTSPRTINYWVYRDDVEDLCGFMVAYGTNAVGAGFGAFVNSNRVYLWGAFDDVDTGYVLPINEWHMLTLQYDGTVRSLWVDGLNVYNQTNSLNTASNKLYFSNNPGAPHSDWGFFGKLDEVRIYNRALSSAEIQSLYQNP